MSNEPRTFRVGDATVTKIQELALDAFTPESLYPSAHPDVANAAAREFGPGSYDRTTNMVRQSIHTWLVRTPERTILVDTATGNDKELPGVPALNHLNEPFLDRLAAAGTLPEEVDVVLLTHIHADHVGWNTRLVDGRWVPTFPNATHIFSGRERAYAQALAAGDHSDVAIRQAAGLGRMARLPAAGIFEVSMLPVIEAGLTQEIAVDGGQALDNFRYLPTPGHSIDHAAIEFTSGVERALFWGDVLHHPAQVVQPDLHSVFCEFPDAALRSRRWALDYAADTGALVFTTHFAESSAGRVIREDDGFRWRFA